MPDGNSDGSQRFEKLRKSASRRRFMATTMAASVGLLAGCPGQSDSDQDTPASTDTDQSTETDGEMSTTESEDTETETPQGPPVTDTIETYIPTLPEQSYLYELADSSAINNEGIGYMMELCVPFREGTTTLRPSGHTWTLEDGTEVEVMTWVKDWEIEAPFDWWETYDDRTTYWDGTDMDAQAYVNQLQLEFYRDGGKFNPGSERWEIEDKWELHQWRERGDAEGTSPNGANSFSIGFSNVGAYEPPAHPDFAQPYAESLKSASTQEEVDGIRQDLQADRVSFTDWAENGWGSGLYEIRSPDNISSDAIMLHAREDHPNYREGMTIPKLRLQIATAERQNIIKNRGQVDLEQQVVEQNAGPVNRNTLPDHIQQLSLTPSNAVFGTPFNWNGKHMQNLWVRRAIITAVDWETLSINATGPNTAVMMEHGTGLSDPISETWFSSDFLDSLHDWPIEADTETAAEYMRKAGYSKQGGTWRDPDGETVELRGVATPELGESYPLAVQSMKSMLDDFGIATSFESLGANAWFEARDNMTYDFTWQWNNQRSPWEAFRNTVGWWDAKIVERDPDFPNSYDGTNDTPFGNAPDLEDVTNDQGEVVDPADTKDLRNQPLTVEIPTDVGNIDAPDMAGRSPDLSGSGIDTKEINLMEHIIELHTDTSLNEERLNTILQDLSWYFNYYIPDWWPVSYATGIMGNVKDFNWLPQGSDGLVTNARLGANMTHYQAQASLMMNKYDEEFPDP